MALTKTAQSILHYIILFNIQQLYNTWSPFSKEEIEMWEDQEIYPKL